MQREDFVEYFFDLTKAFAVQKPQDKSEIYFKKLERLSAETFRKACNHALDTCDRFPTIAKLIELSRLFPDKDRAQFKCDHCLGSGILSKWKHAFRCRCLNGERVSKQIPLVPDTFEEKKAMYERLNQDWNMLYGESVHLPKEGKTIQVKADPDFVDRVKSTFGIMG